MKRLHLFFYLQIAMLGIITVSCGTATDQTDTAKEEDQTEEVITDGEQAITLLQQCLTAHAEKGFETAHYSFDFRGKTYTVKNNDNNYVYTKNFVDTSNQHIFIEMGNNTPFSYTINGKAQNLTNDKQSAIENELNSVIYFATLPHKLGDAAVNKKFLGTTQALGQTYDLLGVTFDEKGGGDDHDDEYLYWINSLTHQIDYFAYNYTVNEGGVRFRSAFNKRVVDGILFQDYLNFKAPIGTPLELLLGLYEQDSLDQVSEILTENIQPLN